MLLKCCLYPVFVFNNYFNGSLIPEDNYNSVHKFVIFVIIKGELAAGG